MPTYAQVTDDILMTMGMTFDDALRNREAVLFNVGIAVDKLTKQILSKQVKVGDALASSDMVSVFPGVEVVHNDVDDTIVTDFDACYFDLPSSIYSLPNGAGVNFVRYMRNNLPHGCDPAVARTPFSPITLANAFNKYQSAYQKPTPGRPAYAQGRAKVGDALTKERVYLFGVSEQITHLLVGLYASVSYTDIDPDDQINLPPEAFHTLKRILLDDEAWILQIPQQRRHNDGRDLEPGEQVRTRPKVGLNDPANADA